MWKVMLLQLGLENNKRLVALSNQLKEILDSGHVSKEYNRNKK